MLEWSASDVGSGIALLEITSTGASWMSVDVDSTEYQFNQPSGIMEGEHVMGVRATDRGGLVTTATVNTILDRTEPTVTITSPRPDQKLKDSTVTIEWAMLDGTSGISQVRISIDGQAYVPLGVVSSYEIPKLDDGVHNITLRVTDRAGNMAETTIEFTVSAGAGISTVMIGAIAVVIIVALVAGAMLMRRKKGPTPEKKEPEKKA
jgi:hypothetical protein